MLILLQLVLTDLLVKVIFMKGLISYRTIYLVMSKHLSSILFTVSAYFLLAISFPHAFTEMNFRLLYYGQVINVPYIVLYYVCQYVFSTLLIGLTHFDIKFIWQRASPFCYCLMFSHAKSSTCNRRIKGPSFICPGTFYILVIWFLFYIAPHLNWGLYARILLLNGFSVLSICIAVICNI